MSISEERGLDQLAERLCAAYISAQMGFASVDYVIKKYVRGIGQPPSEVWFQIAAFVSDVMTRARSLPDGSATETPAGGSPVPATAPIQITRRSKKMRAEHAHNAEK